jgi:hypothetical protein
VLEKVGEDQLFPSCEKLIISYSQGGEEYFYKIRLKATWIGHVYLRNCILQHVNEEKTEVTGVEEGRRHKLLRDDLKETDDIGN